MVSLSVLPDSHCAERAQALFIPDWRAGFYAASSSSMRVV